MIPILMDTLEINRFIETVETIAPTFAAIQLEDICLNVDQMNFPGTTFEHPNWQRKLPLLF